MNVLKRMPLCSHIRRRRLFYEWMTTKDIKIMHELALICLINNALILSKRHNLGGDFLDVLHDSLADLMSDLERDRFDDFHSFMQGSGFRSLWQWQKRAMLMHRPVRMTNTREMRAATNLILAAPIENLEVTDRKWLGAVARDAEILETNLDLACDYFEKKDTDEIPVPTISSHEDDCLARHDIPTVLGSIDTILDARSALILRRTWLQEEVSEDIAVDLGITPDRVRQIHREAMRKMREVFSPDALTEDEKSVVRLKRRKESLGHAVLRPIKGVDLLRARPLFEKILTKTEQQVVRARFFSGPKVVEMKDVAKSLGLSPENVRIIQNTALDRLKLEFTADQAS
ncbi:sigma factor-like helix-turn-helix DNA-binding protein [Loktanella sp. DJP18]|uniref:sigma factor-like helix-turn-helix DNA-binding protein n=1 Tax=Loktanella sp. DJP18 TaxID=3409788 RepID=UPI003BB5D476